MVVNYMVCSLYVCLSTRKQRSFATPCVPPAARYVRLQLRHVLCDSLRLVQPSCTIAEAHTSIHKPVDTNGLIWPQQIFNSQAPEERKTIKDLHCEAL